MIVCIGDSITFGQHLADPNKAWPRLIRGYRVVPNARPGDTTRLGLERFPKDVQEWLPSHVVIQFGHNDGGPIDKDRARGSLKGIGDETQEATIEATQKKEIVRTFGSYLRTYVTDAKAKGAIVVLASPVPRLERLV